MCIRSPSGMMLHSVHSEVSREMFDANRSLQQAVLRLAARARHGRNHNWLRRLRRMSSENLSAQLHLILRSTGYRMIARLYNSFVHSREVRRVIEDDVFDRQLNGLYVFRSIANARKERIDQSKTFFLKIIFIFINIFLFTALESLMRDDDDDNSDMTISD